MADNEYPSEKYETEAKKLLAEVESSQSLAKIRGIFRNFAKNSTVLPHLWNIWLEKETIITFEDYEPLQLNIRLNEIKALAKTHFYFREILDYNYEKFKKCKFGRAFWWCYLNDGYSLNMFPVFFESIEDFPHEAFYEALTFPHDALENFKLYAEQYFTSPLSPEILEKYENAKAMFQEIRDKTNETGNKLSGLEVLLTTKNKNLILENFECALGMIPCEQKVWKMYFDFLESMEDIKKLLTLYSRYCRLFIDDSEMRFKYENELEKQSQSEKDFSKWWMDLIGNEKSFGKTEEVERILQKASKFLQRHQSLLKDVSTIKYGVLNKDDDALNPIDSVEDQLQNFHPSDNLETSPINQPIKFNYKMTNFSMPKSINLTKRFIQPPKAQIFSLPLPLVCYITETCNRHLSLKLGFHPPPAP